MRNLPAVKLGRGDFLDLGNGYGLEVLYPPKKPGPWSLEKYTANNSSLVLRLVKDSQGIALFCGDSESPVLEKLAAMHNAKLHSLEADILILPHHGSESSYAEDFYASVNRGMWLYPAANSTDLIFPPKKSSRIFKRKIFLFCLRQTAGIFLFYMKKNEFFSTGKWFYKNFILYYKEMKLCARLS